VSIVDTIEIISHCTSREFPTGYIHCWGTERVGSFLARGISVDWLLNQSLTFDVVPLVVGSLVFDVSEYAIAFVFRVQRVKEEGTCTA